MLGDWLLCDFHIHTAISDGTVPLEEVVDLYGQKGFDVICITDHILDSADFETRQKVNQKISITQDEFQNYLRRLWQEAQRAWTEYNMLLIPGAEITNNTGKYHILSIDIKEYIDPDLPVAKIVRHIHAQQAVAIACHPHHKAEKPQPHIHLWENHEQYVELFDAWEVANRDDLFNVVGLKKLNYLANSDFHHRRHLYSWKSLLKCEKNTEAVKAAIRDNDKVAVYLFRGEKP